MACLSPCTLRDAGRRAAHSDPGSLPHLAAHRPTVEIHRGGSSRILPVSSGWPSPGLFPSLQVILTQAPSAANPQRCLRGAFLLPQSHLPPLLASSVYAPPWSCLADVFITSIRSCHRFASSPSIALRHIYSKLFIVVPAPSRPLLWPSGCFPTGHCTWASEALLQFS